jgi:hypothetical protein
MLKKLRMKMINRKTVQKKMENMIKRNKKLWFYNMGFWIVALLGSLIRNLVYLIIWLIKDMMFGLQITEETDTLSNTRLSTLATKKTIKNTGHFQQMKWLNTIYLPI